MNNQVIDYIIRIKNASLAKRKRVISSYTKITKEVGDLLVKEGYLEKLEIEKADGKNELVSYIKYHNRLPVLVGVSIVSKPSKRVYTGKTNIKAIERRGRVQSILTTSRGIMTGRKALKEGVGGEVLLKIW